MVEKGSSGALCGIVELHEEEIKRRFLDCVCKVSVWDNALRCTGDVACRLWVGFVQ